jgi:hypothetical protein
MIVLWVYDIGLTQPGYFQRVESFFKGEMGASRS